MGLREYNRVARKTKQASWTLFGEQMDGINDAFKIRIYLSKSHIQAETLLNDWILDCKIAINGNLE